MYVQRILDYFGWQTYAANYLCSNYTHEPCPSLRCGRHHTTRSWALMLTARNSGLPRVRLWDCHGRLCVTQVEIWSTLNMNRLRWSASFLRTIIIQFLVMRRLRPCMAPRLLDGWLCRLRAWMSRDMMCGPCVAFYCLTLSFLRCVFPLFFVRNREYPPSIWWWNSYIFSWKWCRGPKRTAPTCTAAQRASWASAATKRRSSTTVRMTSGLFTRTPLAHTQLLFFSCWFVCFLEIWQGLRCKRRICWRCSLILDWENSSGDRTSLFRYYLLTVWSQNSTALQVVSMVRASSLPHSYCASSTRTSAPPKRQSARTIFICERAEILSICCLLCCFCCVVAVTVVGIIWMLLLWACRCKCFRCINFCNQHEFSLLCLFVLYLSYSFFLFFQVRILLCSLSHTSKLWDVCWMSNPCRSFNGLPKTDRVTILTFLEGVLSHHLQTLILNDSH